jgi:hypothetical protein
VSIFSSYAGTTLRGLDGIEEAGAMRAGARLLLSTALLVGGLGAAGCDTLDDAQRVVDRADLVSDLAARLDRTEHLTYTAVYQLAGGARATIMSAREPSRVAYTYPGGKLIMMPNSYADCRTATPAVSCTVTPVGSPDPGPPAALLGTLGDHGMITPPVVSGLLTATALDADATVEQRDTTIAGQHATCVTVDSVDNAAASAFEVCVTTDGVIGSFTGVLDGKPVEVALTQYLGTVATDAFAIPPGAHLTDLRVAHS